MGGERRKREGEILGKGESQIWGMGGERECEREREQERNRRIMGKVKRVRRELHGGKRTETVQSVRIMVEA